MKSWGARLVVGLKNWRIRNSEAVPDAGRGEQPDQEPIEKTTIKPTPKDSQTSQQVDPANASANIHRADDDREPKTLRASGQLEQTAREAKELSPSTFQLKEPPKQPGAKSAEAGGQPKPGKEMTAQEEATADQTSDREILVSGATTQPDQYPKKQVTGKVLAKRTGRAGGKAAIRTQSKAPPEEVTAVHGTRVLQEPSTGQRSPAKETTGKNSATPVIPASPQKCSRLEKSETTAGQVTDEQLAELEAENARLKLLLRGRLSAEHDSSEN